MFARRQIDRAQFDAGRAYPQLCESSELGALRSIDPGKTRVDGGAFPDLRLPAGNGPPSSCAKSKTRSLTATAVKG
jgi:hypothetical protein